MNRRDELFQQLKDVFQKVASEHDGLFFVEEKSHVLLMMGGRDLCWARVGVDYDYRVSALSGWTLSDQAYFPKWGVKSEHGNIVMETRADNFELLFRKSIAAFLPYQPERQEDCVYERKKKFFVECLETVAKKYGLQVCEDQCQQLPYLQFQGETICLAWLERNENIVGDSFDSFAWWVGDSKVICSISSKLEQELDRSIASHPGVKDYQESYRRFLEAWTQWKV